MDAKGNITAVLDWDAIIALPDCLTENSTTVPPLAFIATRIPGITDEELHKILESTDKTKKSTMAMSRINKLLAEHMFKVEEDLSRVEEWIGEPEVCGILE